MTNLGAHEIDIIQWVNGVKRARVSFLHRRTIRAERLWAKRLIFKMRYSNIPDLRASIHFAKQAQDGVRAKGLSSSARKEA